MQAHYTYSRRSEDDPCEILAGGKPLTYGGLHIHEEEAAKDLCFLLNGVRPIRKTIEAEARRKEEGAAKGVTAERLADEVARAMLAEGL